MADAEEESCDRPHFTFIWTIENACLPIDEYSPLFTVKDMEKTQWSLYIFCEMNTEYGELGISREDDLIPGTIEIKVEFSVLGIDGLPLIKKVGSKTFCRNHAFLTPFLEVNEIFCRRRKEFLPNDELTLRCRMWRAGFEVSRPDLCFARSHLRPDRISFVWAIREFSTLRVGEVRKLFLLKTPVEERSLDFCIKDCDGEEYINIVFKFPNLIYRSAKVCLLDFEGEVVQSGEETLSLRFYCEFKNFFKRSRLIDDKASLLPNDVLTLRCEIEGFYETVRSRIENYRYLKSMNSNTIATDAGEILRFEQDETSDSYSFTNAMKALLQEGDLSDVHLGTPTRSFPAHKCILSARSPVFKAMFSGDMKEKTRECVEIPDIDEDIMQELLSYIYTNAIGELKWKSALDLYRAADKYELLDLKQKCSTFLKSELSESNACAILTVADMHHDPELREKAQDFILRRGRKYFSSDTWRRFKEENFKLYVEILERRACDVEILD